MLSSSSTASPFSAHADVLDVPIPQNGNGSERDHLVAELKRRGAAAVGAGQWPDAAALYTKAVQCCSGSVGGSGNVGALPSSPSNERQQDQSVLLAIVSANLSLCQGKMRLWTEALQSAETAATADPTYVKAWWRLGQAQAALHQYDSAVASLTRAESLLLLLAEAATAVQADTHSNNNTNKTLKLLQRELDKLRVQHVEYQQQQQKLQQQQTEKASEVVLPPPMRAAIDTTATTAATPESLKPNTDATSNEQQMGDDDNDDFTKSDHIKGYKVINGKKTSYFHHELSPEAARLIGDIQPQKLSSSDSTNATTTTAVSSSSSSGTSAWNTAGTWEEKDCSEWARTTLIQHVEASTCTLPLSSPAPGAILSVEKLVITNNNNKGHASVTTVRGKKRHFYEFDLTVHWSFAHSNNTPTDKTTAVPILDASKGSTTITASGTMRFPDVDGTDSNHDVSDFVIVERSDSTLSPLLVQFCHLGGLRLAIQNQIDAWVELFQTTY